MATNNEEITGDRGSAENGRDRQVRFLRASATALMSAGFLSPLLGITLFIIRQTVGGNRPLSRIGTGLIVSAIPLLLIGSHLLDMSDDRAGRK